LSSALAAVARTADERVYILANFCQSGYMGVHEYDEYLAA
jgi:hypothetical protein